VILTHSFMRCDVNTEVIFPDIIHAGSRLRPPGMDDDCPEHPERRNFKSQREETKSPSDKYQWPITLCLPDVS
jgi:hypothetical protein